MRDYAKNKRSKLSAAYQFLLWFDKIRVPEMIDGDPKYKLNILWPKWKESEKTDT